MIEHRFAAWGLAAAALAGIGEAQAPLVDNADASAPNAANYDEALANPYPILPDALTLKSGAKVTTPELWWDRRRAELVEDFEREVVGRVPAAVPNVNWTVVQTREWDIGGKPLVGRQLVGTVDNSAYPVIDVEICMTLVTPADAAAVPVMIVFGGGALEELPDACRPAARPGAPAALPPGATSRSSSGSAAGRRSICQRCTLTVPSVPPS